MNSGFIRRLGPSTEDFLSPGHSIELKFFTSIELNSQEYIDRILFIYRNSLFVYQNRTDFV